jgi:hypothetical protein
MNRRRPRRGDGWAEVANPIRVVGLVVAGGLAAGNVVLLLLVAPRLNAGGSTWLVVLAVLGALLNAWNALHFVRALLDEVRRR